MPQVERSFVSTKSGRIHVAAAGAGAPVLLLHQTPRSWDEFREVLPILGRHYRVIAMDTVGYGDSDPLPNGQASIENWASAAHALLHALGVPRAAIVGHHTGAAIAVEMAAAYPRAVAEYEHAIALYISLRDRGLLPKTLYGKIDELKAQADECRKSTCTAPG